MEIKPYLRALRVVKPGADDDRSDDEPSDAYPFGIPAIKALAAMDELTFAADMTFIIGENGSGKSTLLEAIAIALGMPAQGGTRNVMLEEAGTRSPLADRLKLRRSFQKPRDHFFLRAESFYNLATYMDEVGYLAGYGNKSLHKRSHGEAFITTIMKKFKGKGLYLLDEPEAALSPERQLIAMQRFNELINKDSQFIIATHSPILLAYPGATIYLLDEDGLREVEYQDTEHYIITHDFLNSYPRRLEQLLTDDLEDTQNQHLD